MLTQSRDAGRVCVFNPELRRTVLTGQRQKCQIALEEKLGRYYVAVETQDRAAKKHVPYCFFAFAILDIWRYYLMKRATKNLKKWTFWMKNCVTMHKYYQDKHSQYIFVHWTLLCAVSHAVALKKKADWIIPCQVIKRRKRNKKVEENKLFRIYLREFSVLISPQCFATWIDGMLQCDWRQVFIIQWFKYFFSNVLLGFEGRRENMNESSQESVGV